MALVMQLDISDFARENCHHMRTALSKIHVDILLCAVKPVEGNRRREPTSVSSYFELSLRLNNNKAPHHEDSNRANNRRRGGIQERESVA